LRRLFKRWDKDSKGQVTLQDVVSGMAQIKGRRDIMGSITYFFELYDDDGDGRVDREGILRISEALLFLSRRGLDGNLSPSASHLGLNGLQDSGGNGNSMDESYPGTSVNERFLGSVSAFIRRCFEYADPDHPRNHDAAATGTGGNGTEDDIPDPSAFTIGEEEEDEEEEDLLDLDDTPKEETAKKAPKKSGIPPAISLNTTGPDGRRHVSKAESEKANIALDPSNPLYMTLPTFRMVILADELLEQFFESSFPASFHIIQGLPSSTSSSNLTTFSSLGQSAGRVAAAAIGGAPAVVVGGNRGLRGVLDGIVTDGMRMAAEVRRRMDEAQKELEKNAAPGQKAAQDDEEEDEEDIDIHTLRTPTTFGDIERRSIRSVKHEDRLLLEGADAEAGGGNGKGDGGEGGAGTAGDGDGGPKARPGSVIEEAGATRTVEFDG
jgi:hypothetical protein